MKLTKNKKTIFKNCKIESNANNLIINCDFSGAKLNIVTIVIFSMATNFLHFVSRLTPIKDVPIPAEYQTTSFCNHYSSMNMKNLCMMLNVITFFSTSLRKTMNQALHHGSLAIFSVTINFFKNVANWLHMKNVWFVPCQCLFQGTMWGLKSPCKIWKCENLGASWPKVFSWKSSPGPGPC